MVIDNQGRQYGGISFEPMYPSNMHTTPHFSDPWSHQTGSNQSYQSMSKPESRPALSMPYSQMPPVSAPLASGSQFSILGYGGSDVLSVGQDIPRSTYNEQNYSAPSTSGSTYVTSYPSMNYAQSLAQQQHHQHEQHQKLSSP
jgi:hypothetical protein